MQPEFLSPQCTTACIAQKATIQQISDDAAHGTSDDVEQSEHSGPLAGVCLAEGREVALIVCSQDGIDGQFAAERVKVTEGQHKSLWGEDDGHAGAEGWCLDDFAAGAVHGLRGGWGGVVVRLDGGFAGWGRAIG